MKPQPKTGKVEPQADTTSAKDNKKNSKANQEKVESGTKKQLTRNLPKRVKRRKTRMFLQWRK